MILKNVVSGSVEQNALERQVCETRHWPHPPLSLDLHGGTAGSSPDLQCPEKYSPETTAHCCSPESTAGDPREEPARAAAERGRNGGVRVSEGSGEF